VGVRFGAYAQEMGKRTAKDRIGQPAEWPAPSEARRRGMLWRGRASATAKKLLHGAAIKLLIPAECEIALRYDHLGIEEVVTALASRRPDLHVVVTGRTAKPD
jgi:cob(I)alamin adenosyltransferase